MYSKTEDINKLLSIDIEKYIYNKDLRYKWDTIIAFLTLFFAIEVPLCVVFQFSPSGILLWFDIFASILLILDVYIRYYYVVDEKYNIPKNTEPLKKEYLKFSIYTDIIAAIPIELMSLLIINLFIPTPSFLLIFSQYANITRLFRIKRLIHFLKLWQMEHSFGSSTARLLIFGFWFLLTAHWVACGWLLLDGIPEFNSDKQRYIRGIYWCITTLATVGYGDITPKTDGK